jgi:hypothetical protein
MIYKVRQWFLPALQILATQDHRPMTTHDVVRLGLQFSLNVAKLQGKVKGFNLGKGTPSAFGQSSVEDLGKGKVKGFNFGKGSPSVFGQSSVEACPVVEFIRELFPAAIVSSIPGREGSRAWDPMTSSFLSPAEDPTQPAGEPFMSDVRTPSMGMPAGLQLEFCSPFPQPAWPLSKEKDIGPSSPVPESCESLNYVSCPRGLPGHGSTHYNPRQEAEKKRSIGGEPEDDQVRRCYNIYQGYAY